VSDHTAPTPEQDEKWTWSDEARDAAWNAAERGRDADDVLDALAPFAAAREAAARDEGRTEGIAEGIAEGAQVRDAIREDAEEAFDNFTEEIDDLRSQVAVAQQSINMALNGEGISRHEIVRLAQKRLELRAEAMPAERRGAKRALRDAVVELRHAADRAGTADQTRMFSACADWLDRAAQVIEP
jgi:hypothetical protein